MFPFVPAKRDWFLVAPKVGSAPTSPPFQGGANLPQLLGGMVVLRGNAPRSSGYRPGALLLSYGTAMINGASGFCNPAGCHLQQTGFAWACAPVQLMAFRYFPEPV